VRNALSLSHCLCYVIPNIETNPKHTSQRVQPSVMAFNSPRPLTPPPFDQPYGQDQDDPRGWFWDDDAGGMYLRFGKWRDHRLRDISLNYLLWLRQERGNVSELDITLFLDH
jgi:hypothetical protein